MTVYNEERSAAFRYLVENQDLYSRYVVGDGAVAMMNNEELFILVQLVNLSEAP